ncbi:MAG: DUF4363 family protein [Firmicutes bacterium]|nr:DUF4363 family protein [Bacillota bacterium]
MTRSTVSGLTMAILWILTVLLVAGAHGIIRAQESLARTLVMQLRRAEGALAAGDWSAAASIAVDVRREWEAARPGLSLHADHQHLDLVTEALLETETLIAARNIEAVRALRLAAERLRSLPERERLLLRNLF